MDTPPCSKQGDKWTESEGKKLLECRAAKPDMPWRQFQEEFFPHRTRKGVNNKYIKLTGERQSGTKRSCYSDSLFGDYEENDAATGENWGVGAYFRDSPNGRLRKIHRVAGQEEQPSRLDSSTVSDIYNALVNISSQRPGRSLDPENTSFAAIADVNGNASSSTLASDDLLEHMDTTNWQYILQQAKECKSEKMRAMNAQRERDSLENRLAKSNAELKRLRGRLEHNTQTLSWHDISVLDTYSRISALKAACDRMMVTSKAYMAPVNWYSQAMTEAVEGVERQFEELGEMALRATDGFF